VRPRISASQAACLMLVTLLSPCGRAGAHPDSGPMINTTAGAVSGTDGETLTFKGIPYAASPTGPLRWRPPQPPLAWQGVRVATRFGDDCMQMPYVIPTGQKASEDCLTINVWTPAHRTRVPRPVMVFLYGGAFIGGSGRSGSRGRQRLLRRRLVLSENAYLKSECSQQHQ